MIALCNTALVLILIEIFADAKIYTWIYHHTERDFGPIKYEALLIIVMAVVIGGILLVLRDHAKEVLANAFRDVTGINNKKSLEKRLQLLQQRDDTLNIGIMIFDLNNLKKVNDTYGHEKGDMLIQSFASCLARIITTDSFLARFGGDEFVIIQENTTVEELKFMDQKLQQQIDEYNLGTELPISYAVGYDVSYKNHYFLLEDLMDAVDKKMYQDKQEKKGVRQMILGTGTPPGAAVSATSPEVFASKMHRILYKNQHKNYALIMSDVENFHLINETYGYATGNGVLELLSRELAVFEKTVISNRFHNDVFINVTETGDLSEKEYIEKISNENKYVEQLVRDKYGIRYIKINTGIYFIKNDPGKPENAISFANIARRRARKYRNHICVYTEMLDREEKLNGEILHSFQSAIEKEEFAVFFQPKVDAKTKVICGAEALVRWMKPDGTMLPPDQFIPLLEKTGFITELDFYVYEKTFQWIARRKAAGQTVVPISVNVSPCHLNNPEVFLYEIFQLMENYHIRSEDIIFEITETMFIEQPEMINRIITEFHDRNITISMDDFGSGYSSLNSLKDILFDEIKLDKQFLEEKLSQNGKIVLEEIFHMLKRMKKSIVCEGVETKEISDFLESQGCHRMQGFYYYKPMKEEEFCRVLGE